MDADKQKLSTDGRSFSHWVSDHFDPADYGTDGRRGSGFDATKRSKDIAEFAAQNVDYFNKQEGGKPKFKAGTPAADLYDSFESSYKDEPYEEPKFDEGSDEAAVYESFKASSGYADDDEAAGKAQQLLGDTLKRIKNSGHRVKDLEGNIDRLVSANVGFLNSGND